MSVTTEKSCLNIDLESYKELVDLVDQDPEQGKFTFSARTEWENGAVTRTVARDNVIQADEPEALGGTDTAADPVELLLSALTSCVSIGLITRAADRGIDFDELEIEVEGALDLRGYFGLDENIRPGYEGLEYTVRIQSDADPVVIEQLLRETEQSSPMYDNIRNGVPIRSSLEVAS